jgi:uncharacterized membrane protein
MTRIYQIVSLILAPFFTLGGIMLAKFGSRAFRLPSSKAYALILIVLIPFFLFQSQFVYEVAGAPSWSVPLSRYRMNDPNIATSVGIVDETEIFGAIWLARNIENVSAPIYADFFCRYTVLTSYGLIGRDRVLVIFNNTRVASKSYVYLGKLNVVNEAIPQLPSLRDQRSWFNTNEINSTLEEINKIYANGACEIYRSER